MSSMAGGRAEYLVMAQQRVEKARAELARAVARRDAAVVGAHDAGETIYGIAKRLGVSQAAVRKMLGKQSS